MFANEDPFLSFKFHNAQRTYHIAGSVFFSFHLVYFLIFQTFFCFLTILIINKLYSLNVFKICFNKKSEIWLDNFSLKSIIKMEYKKGKDFFLKLAIIYFYI